MRIDILSLFPQIAEAALNESMMKRAQEAGLVEIHSHNLRDWATDKHRTTDDAPYGGGQGMVMKCEPIFAAVEAAAHPGGARGLPLARRPPAHPGARRRVLRALRTSSCSAGTTKGSTSA